VLTAEHMFDDTPGRAEVQLVYPEATYDDRGGCDNLYCHGDGRTNGRVDHRDAPLSCSGCHGYLDSLSDLSGPHEAHFLAPLAFPPVTTCSECHTEEIGEGPDGLPAILSGLEAHVNGEVELALPSDPAGDNMQTELNGAGQRRCNGTCHGVDHNPLGLGNAVGIGLWSDL
jgi:predicted CxxxxCH...CXXCH cytochrome family protein